MPADEWYYQVMGEEMGPVTASQLKEHARRGDLQPDAKVRRGTDGSWVTANKVRGLFETHHQQARPTPPPPIETDDYLAAVEAFQTISTQPNGSYGGLGDKLPGSPTTKGKLERRYPFLRVIVIIYCILGIVSLPIAGLLILFLISTEEPQYVEALYVLVVFSFASISLLATAELITVFLDTEENTRRTNKILEEWKSSKG